MTQRLGKFAALRPEKVSEFSTEFKRDLLENDDGLVNTHKKRSHSSESSSTNSSSSSSSESSEESRRKRKRRRRRRRSSAKTEDKSSERKPSNENNRRRSSEHDSRRRSSDPRNGRRESVTSSRDKSRNDRDRERSRHKSPSDIEKDSDLESNGLNVKYKLEPLIHYLHEDREQFNRQIFKIIRGRRRQRLLPKILHDFTDKELKQACLSELAQWTNKRIRILMRTGKLLPDEHKSALRKISPDTMDIEGTELPSSEDEDIETMNANLQKWRDKKINDEMKKLRAKQQKELDALAAEEEEQYKLLEKKLEEREKERSRLAELNAKMAEVQKNIAKEKGLILVEKSTLKKVKPKEPEPEEEKEEEKPNGEVDPNAEPGSDANTSLVMNENEESSSDPGRSVDQLMMNVDDIPLADSPSRQQQMPRLKVEKTPQTKVKKESKEKDKKSKKKKKDDAGEEEGAVRENLCPDVPYSGGKKERKQMVKDWLANFGRDGPPLPVPEENYYPDYADPNTENALKEIEDLQEAYEISRLRSGRTDGKLITKLTGEEVFAGEEDDMDDTGGKNEVAKRMLKQMLGSNKAVRMPPQPNYNQNDKTKYTDTKTYGPQIPQTEAVIYQRDGDKGELKFSKDARQEEKSRGLGEAVLQKPSMEKAKNVNTLLFLEKPKSRHEQAREQMQAKECEMRARAIKAMMEKTQKKKIKKEIEEKAVTQHEGEFPWQDDYEDF